MGKLITTPNLARHDDIYDRLIALHTGRDDAESQRLNARLILLLLNHIGDEDVILEALRIAAHQSAEAQ